MNTAVGIISDRSYRTTSCKLVVDFLLEKEHLLTSQLTKEPQELGSTEEAVESKVGVGIILCPAQNLLSTCIDFLSNFQPTLLFNSLSE